MVTKCLRNPRKAQFPTCFPPFSLTFPRVSHSVSPVSLGISCISPGVSPSFLFQVLREKYTIHFFIMNIYYVRDFVELFQFLIFLKGFTNFISPKALLMLYFQHQTLGFPCKKSSGVEVVGELSLSKFTKVTKVILNT